MRVVSSADCINHLEIIRYARTLGCYAQSLTILLTAEGMHCLPCHVTTEKGSHFLGHEGKFSWRQYLASTQSRPAPVTAFTTTVPAHAFKQGLKLEAADLMDPRWVLQGPMTLEN